MKKHLGILSSLTASIFLALCSLSCCIAPLLFVLFGVTLLFAEYLSYLAPFRWLFVLLAIASLSYAFWRIFLPKKPVCCDSTLNTKTQKILFVIFAILSALMIVYPFIDGLFWGNE